MVGGNAPSPDSGSENGEPEYFLVAKITRPHGVRGELKAQIITHYPERLKQIKTLYLGNDHRPMRIQGLRYVNEGILLRFDSVSDRTTADLYRGQMVYIHRNDAVQLEEGEYYLYQAEGLEVVTDAGEVLGKITDVIETGANDVYVVTRPDGTEILLPVIPDVIQNVDTQSRKMIVHLIDGLI